MAAPPPSDDSVIGVLRCDQCGRKVDCREAQLVEYAQSENWPRCCNEVMRLYGRDKGSSEYAPLKNT